MTKCTPTPDVFQSFYDDNFEKIPRTNSAIRHLLLSSCTFKCLTLFPIRFLITHVRSTFFSLSGYELANKDWQFDLTSNIKGKLKNLNIGHPQCKFASTTANLIQCKMRNFIFYMEFVINDSVCMVYKGNTTPGHSSKNSLLDREFTKLNTSHKDECIGESFTLVPPCAQDLTYKESKSLKCSMEHNRILFNGSDRQHASLNHKLTNLISYDLGHHRGT